MSRRPVGGALALIGAALSYTLLASPGNRIGGKALDVLMWFGPLVLTAGLLLLPSSRAAVPAPADRSSTLIKRGLALLAVPALLVAYALLAESELAGMLFTLSVFVSGLPGLVLLTLGLHGAWRKRGISR